jgi:hypothetical protein
VKDGGWSNSDCVGERDKNGNFICECKKVGPTTVVEIFGEQEKKFNEIFDEKIFDKFADFEFHKTIMFYIIVI